MNTTAVTCAVLSCLTFRFLQDWWPWYCGQKAVVVKGVSFCAVLRLCEGLCEEQNFDRPTGQDQAQISSVASRLRLLVLCALRVRLTRQTGDKTMHCPERLPW